MPFKYPICIIFLVFLYQPQGLQGFCPARTEELADPIVGEGWGAENSVELTDDNWADNVEDDSKNWIVIFYKPSCCKKFQKEWVKVGDMLKGSDILVGHINGEENPQTKDKYYRVSKYPTIIAFTKRDREGDNEYTDKKTAQKIVDWAKEQAEETPDN